EILAYEAERDRIIPIDGSGPTPMASTKARFSAD
ncbi:carbonic anhydrase, partial [Pseudomonas syringae pv. tagetis]